MATEIVSRITSTGLVHALRVSPHRLRLRRERDAVIDARRTARRIRRRMYHPSRRVIKSPNDIFVERANGRGDRVLLRGAAREAVSQIALMRARIPENTCPGRGQQKRRLFFLVFNDVDHFSGGRHWHWHWKRKGWAEADWRRSPGGRGMAGELM